MATQAPSSNFKDFIDIGNAIVYFAPSAFTSFSSAASATTWRKLGILKQGVNLNVEKARVDVKSGVPQRLVKTFYTEEMLRVAGEIMEVTPLNISRVLGGVSITTAVKASSPAATTVATGSTKTVVNFTSATGYAVGDLIRTGNASNNYQYGVIKSISGNAVTMVEALDGDASPTTGHAIAKVDTMKLNMGSVATPANIALKISKTMVGDVGTLDFYLPNVIADGNTTFNWGDNGTVEPVGLPFLFEAISDPDVESGATAQLIWTQA